jgi:hypothetical protein
MAGRNQWGGGSEICTCGYGFGGTAFCRAAQRFFSGKVARVRRRQKQKKSHIGELE